MKIILPIIYTIIFWIIIRNHRFFKIDGIRNEAMRLVFLLKIVSGFALLFMYTYYYTDRSTSDIYKYFDDGVVMYKALFHNPLDYIKMLFGVLNDNEYFTYTYYNQMSHWFRSFESNIFSDSHAIIRFNAFVMLFSFGHIGVHVVFMVFLSFVGLTALYRFFLNYAKKSKIGLFVAVFLLPSVLFWGSGLLKEGLIFFSLGLLLYEFNKISKRFNLFSLFWIVFSCLLLIHTKIFIVLIVTPLLISLLYSEIMDKRKVKYLFVTVVAVFFILGFFTFYNIAGLNLFSMIVQKQNDFVQLALQESASSLLHERFLELSFFSFTYELLIGFFNVAFRPLIFIDNSIVYLPNILENMVIICLMIGVIFFRVNLNRFELSLVHFCFWFVMGIYVITGITVPILGAIVRYKVIAMPFLFAIMMILIDKRKVFEKIPFLKKYYDYLSHKISYKSIMKKD